MTDEEYPGPTITETAATCPTLARLPKLPVTVLVLRDPTEDEGRRRIGARLLRLASELGVGDGVVVQEHEIESWAALDDSPPRGRFDAVFLCPDTIPGAWDDPTEPRDEVVDALARLFDIAETRFAVLCPPDEGAERRRSLTLRLMERGGPPLVVVPADWNDPEVGAFVEGLFERLLHDSPLVRAITDAAAERSGEVQLVRPPGRRHGLDLGRLLEDHRRRIEEGGSALRSFRRQVEAERPEQPDPRWTEVSDGTEARQDELDAIKEAVEEINRDRDPAGWSRLGVTIARLERWESGLERARRTLEAIRDP